MRNKELNKSLEKFYNKKQNTQELLYGELGIPLNGIKKVSVDGRPGYVYVRLRGSQSELVQAYNSAVPLKYNFPVIVSRKRNTYTVLGRDEVKYSNSGNQGVTPGYSSLPNHGSQHSLAARLGLGSDPAWIFGEQFIPNTVYPSGTSMSLTTYPYFYEWNGSFKVPNANSMPDFTPYKPTATGSARLVTVAINGDSGNYELFGGVGFSGGIYNNSELAPYIPDVDRGNYIPIAAVKLETGTTSLSYENIYDVRDFITTAKPWNGIGIQDSTTPQGTGTTLNFGSNLSVSMAGGVATIDASGGGGGDITAQDEGSILGTGTVFNFVGDGVTASISGTVFNVNVPGGGGGGGGNITAQDEGSLLGTGTVFNFVGDGVTSSISGSVFNINVPGGGGGGGGGGSTAVYQESPTAWADQSIVVSGSAASISHNTSQNYAYVWLQSTPADGQMFENELVCEAGTYTVKMLSSKDNNRGKVDIYIDGSLIGTVDQYNSSLAFNVVDSISNVDLTAGRHVVKFVVNGKNASSSDYYIVWTKLWLEPSSFSQGSGTVSGGTIVAQDEGSVLGTGTTLNFVGDGVTSSISGSVFNVNVPGGGGGAFSISFATGTTQEGRGTNRTSGGTYHHHATWLTINYPMKLKTLKWDVGHANTYSCKMFHGYSTGTVALIDFGSTGTSGAARVEFSPPDGDFFLMPGAYTLQLSTPTALTIKDNTANPVVGESWFPSHSLHNTLYNTTQDRNYSAAIFLVFYKGTESYTE